MGTKRRGGKLTCTSPTSSPLPPKKIFVSHADEDRRVAEEIALALRGRNYDVFPNLIYGWGRIDAAAAVGAVE